MASVADPRPLLKDEIRLVDFGAEPGKPTLIHVPLFSNTPKYVALSYCWGKDNCLHKFTLNGQALILTSSLLNVFCGLQSRGFKGKIWADAICIGQTDDKEKAAQIALMGDIFRLADFVIAWLHQPSESSVYNLQAGQMDDLLAKVSDTKAQLGVGFFDIMKDVDVPTRDSGFWQSLVDLLGNPWYFRLWILQEAVLAKRLIIYFGTLEWSLKSLSDLEHQLLRLNFVLSVGASRFGIRDLAGPIRTQQVVDLHASGKLRNSDLLYFSTMRQTTNDCDKIYSLYNLGDLRAAVPLDLAATPQRVFIRGAKAVMKHDNHGLCLLGTVQSRNRLSGLPSWVPDLRQKAPIAIGNVIRDSCAGQSDRQRPPPRVSLQDTDDTLGLHGFVLDTIQDVLGMDYAIWTVDSPSRDYAMESKRIVDWLDACLQLAKKTLTVPEVDAKWMCYKTLVTDMPTVHKPAWFSDETMRDLEALQTQYQNCAEGRDWNIAGLWSLVTSLAATTRHRRLFATEGGRIGLGPESAQAGDVILVLYGDTVVEVARKRPLRDTFEFLGQAYIDGVMDGEAVQQHEASGAPDELFVFD